MKNKIWYVTGASKGLGLSLAKRLLAEGYRVAATSRNLSSLRAVLGPATDSFLPLEVDLQNESSVAESLQKSVAHFKGLDVVVNNAGYGQFGTIEELSDAEVRENYSVNVFGMLNVIRAALPFLREQKSGHILNISSIGGFVGSFPGVGVYCSTKFAVAGLSEGLAAELKPFGINVSLVYPGYFRTNFLDKDSMALPKAPIIAYAYARQNVDTHKDSINKNQPGDPEKAAAAMIQLTQEQNPPFHFFMGSDSVALAKKKLDDVRVELETWQKLSESTEFDA
jgi:NAD(P)-dependent dehydrogenase (short-subunit alcohol dehydrogenase family)